MEKYPESGLSDVFQSSPERKAVPSLTERLCNNKPNLLLLDGATGTELSARGFDIDRPGWSALALIEAPGLLFQIHQDYVQAGAEILTANTFRTHEENLKLWGQEGRSRELTLQAIHIARKAARGKAYVVGSLAPVGDCYSPEKVPAKSILIRSHRQMAQNMAQAGVDAVLVETHISCEELQIACEAVNKAGLPLLVSLQSNSGKTMFDGTSLKDAIVTVTKFSPLAVGVNCLPAEEVSAALDELNIVSDLPKIIYANAGRLLNSGQWEATAGADLAQHIELARSWMKKNVRILGGCCGTSPALIAKFAKVFSD